MTPYAWEWRRKENGVHGIYTEDPAIFGIDISDTTLYDWKLLYERPVTQTFWCVREIESKTICRPKGVSSAPHLYRTKGIANAAWKRRPVYWRSKYEVIEVHLEIPE